jgi:Phage derived protein Gp49-like (DUF891)
MRLYLVRHPDKVNSVHPRIIEDLLELSEDNQLAINAMIEMLHDLYKQDLNTRYAKKLKDYPLWELKTRARGGIKGGARIYFFIENDIAFIVNAEVKTGNEPSEHKLEEALEILVAHRAGRTI